MKTLEQRVGTSKGAFRDKNQLNHGFSSHFPQTLAPTELMSSSCRATEKYLNGRSEIYQPEMKIDSKWIKGTLRDTINSAVYINGVKKFHIKTWR